MYTVSSSGGHKAQQLWCNQYTYNTLQKPSAFDAGVISNAAEIFSKASGRNSEKSLPNLCVPPPRPHLKQNAFPVMPSGTVGQIPSAGTEETCAWLSYRDVSYANISLQCWRNRFGSKLPATSNQELPIITVYDRNVYHFLLTWAFGESTDPTVLLSNPEQEERLVRHADTNSVSHMAKHHIDNLITPNLRAKRFVSVWKRCLDGELLHREDMQKNPTMRDRIVALKLQYCNFFCRNIINIGTTSEFLNMDLSYRLHLRNTLQEVISADLKWLRKIKNTVDVSCVGRHPENHVAVARQRLHVCQMYAYALCLNIESYFRQGVVGPCYKLPLAMFVQEMALSGKNDISNTIVQNCVTPSHWRRILLADNMTVFKHILARPGEDHWQTILNYLGRNNDPAQWIRYDNYKLVSLSVEHGGRAFSDMCSCLREEEFSCFPVSLHHALNILNQVGGVQLKAILEPKSVRNENEVTNTNAGSYEYISSEEFLSYVTGDMGRYAIYARSRGAEFVSRYFKNYRVEHRITWFKTAFQNADWHLHCVLLSNLLVDALQQNQLIWLNFLLQQITPEQVGEGAFNAIMETNGWVALRMISSIQPATRQTQLWNLLSSATQEKFCKLACNIDLKAPWELGPASGEQYPFQHMMLTALQQGNIVLANSLLFGLIKQAKDNQENETPESKNTLALRFAWLSALYTGQEKIALDWSAFITGLAEKRQINLATNAWLFEDAFCTVLQAAAFGGLSETFWTMVETAGITDWQRFYEESLSVILYARLTRPCKPSDFIDSVVSRMTPLDVYDMILYSKNKKLVCQIARNGSTSDMEVILDKLSPISQVIPAKIRLDMLWAAMEQPNTEMLSYLAFAKGFCADQMQFLLSEENWPKLLTTLRADWGRSGRNPSSISIALASLDSIVLHEFIQLTLATLGSKTQISTWILLSRNVLTAVMITAWKHPPLKEKIDQNQLLQKHKLNLLHDDIEICGEMLTQSENTAELCTTLSKDPELWITLATARNFYVLALPNMAQTQSELFHMLICALSPEQALGLLRAPPEEFAQNLRAAPGAFDPHLARLSTTRDLAAFEGLLEIILFTTPAWRSNNAPVSPSINW